MRLLHLSDWHLGRETYNTSRAGDHDAVISEMLGYAREHKPDLIVHTGDLFDAVRPAYPEMTRGVNALQELAVTAPVVVLCGNHDSPALFDLFDQLIGPESRVRFVSRARPPDQGGILSFPTAADEVIRLAPLPFVHANRMLAGFEEPGTWSGVYADRIHLIEQGLARGLDDGFDIGRDVGVFAAHLYVGNAVLSGSERKIQVGIPPRFAMGTRSEHVGTRAVRQVRTKDTAHDVSMIFPQIERSRHRRRCCNWSSRYIASARKSGMPATTCAATVAA